MRRLVHHSVVVGLLVSVAALTVPQVNVFDDIIGHSDFNSSAYTTDAPSPTCLGTQHPDGVAMYSRAVKLLDNFYASTVPVSDVLKFNKFLINNFPDDHFPDTVPQLHWCRGEWSFSWTTPRNLLELRRILTVFACDNSAAGTVYPSVQRLVLWNGTTPTEYLVADLVSDIVVRDPTLQAAAVYYACIVVRLSQWDLQRMLLHPDEATAGTPTELASVIHNGIRSLGLDAEAESGMLADLWSHEMLNIDALEASSGDHQQGTGSFSAWFSSQMDLVLRMIAINNDADRVDVSFWRGMADAVASHHNTRPGCPPAEGGVNSTDASFAEQVIGSAVIGSSSGKQTHLVRYTDNKRSLTNFTELLGNTSTLYKHFEDLRNNDGLSEPLRDITAMRLEILFMLGLYDLVPVLDSITTDPYTLVSSAPNDVFRVLAVDAIARRSYSFSLTLFYRTLSLSGTLFDAVSHRERERYQGQDIFALWQEAKAVIGDLVIDKLTYTEQDYYLNQGEEGALGLLPIGAFPAFGEDLVGRLEALSVIERISVLREVEQTVPLATADSTEHRADVCPEGLIFMPDPELAEKVQGLITSPSLGTGYLQSTSLFGRCLCPREPVDGGVMVYSVQSRSCYEAPNYAQLSMAKLSDSRKPYYTSGVFTAVYSVTVDSLPTPLRLRAVPLEPIGYRLTIGGIASFRIPQDPVDDADLSAPLVLPDDVLADFMGQQPRPIVYNTNTGTFMVQKEQYPRLLPVDPVAPSALWRGIGVQSDVQGEQHVLRVKSELSCRTARVGILPEDLVASAALRSGSYSVPDVSIPESVQLASLVLAAASGSSAIRSILLGTSGVTQECTDAVCSVALGPLTTRGFVFALCLEASAPPDLDNALQQRSLAVNTFLASADMATVAAQSEISVLPAHKHADFFTPGFAVLSESGAFGLSVRLTGDQDDVYRPFALTCDGSGGLAESRALLTVLGWRLCLNGVDCLAGLGQDTYTVPLSELGEPGVVARCSVCSADVQCSPYSDFTIPSVVDIVDREFVEVPSCASASQLAYGDGSCAMARLLPQLFAMPDITGAHSIRRSSTLLPSVFFRVVTGASRLAVRLEAERLLAASAGAWLLSEGWSHSATRPNINLTGSGPVTALLMVSPESDGGAAQQTIFIDIDVSDDEAKCTDDLEFGTVNTEYGPLPAVFEPGLIVWPAPSLLCATAGTPDSSTLFEATAEHPYVIPEGAETLSFAIAAAAVHSHFCVARCSTATLVSVASLLTSLDSLSTDSTDSASHILPPLLVIVLTALFLVLDIAIIVFFSTTVGRHKQQKTCAWCGKHCFEAWEAADVVPRLSKGDPFVRPYPLCAQCMWEATVAPGQFRGATDNALAPLSFWRGTRKNHGFADSGSQSLLTE